MNYNTDEELGCAVSFIILIALIILGACIGQPFFESRAYNKLTGAHTTYWDALWLDLRVMDNPKH